MHPRLIPFGTGYGYRVTRTPSHPTPGEEMSQSDDRSQQPWTDPQTHLDTDPVNAEPTPADADHDAPDEEDDS